MLESKRLLYRQFTYDDFEDLYEILSDELVCEYLPGEGAYSKETIEKWLNFFVRNFNDDLGNKHFAVIEKDTSKLIAYGGIGYVEEFKQCEIMYGLNRSAWNKGYATEISKTMKLYAKELGHDFLIALADVRNIASQKVLLKTGFKQIKKIPLWGLDLYYYEIKM